jgi:hypothetical protein
MYMYILESSNGSLYRRRLQVSSPLKMDMQTRNSAKKYVAVLEFLKTFLTRW